MRLLILIIISASFSFQACSNLDTEAKAIEADSLITITISAVGDLMCHSVQYNYARVENDSFDFNPAYREVQKYLSEADFTFGNLETVTAGKKKGYSGYPFFNSPDEFIPALKNAGFDLLTTANNHSLDKGEIGLLRTIGQIEKNNLNYNGTFKSKNDRDSIRIFNIKGINVAFLAYSYGTNGIPVPAKKNYLINLIDFVLIKNDIKSAKKNGADLVLVHYHFGEEYRREPNKYQKTVVDSTIKFGADIIIGGHPHVVQPVDYFKTNNTKIDTGIIAYSLGNFVSNQRWRYSDAGVILTIEVTKNINNNSIFISEVNYMPTWVFKGNTNNGREYVILPSGTAFNNFTFPYLSASDKRKMVQAFEDTKEIMTKYSDKIMLKNPDKNPVEKFFEIVKKVN